MYKRAFNERVNIGEKYFGGIEITDSTEFRRLKQKLADLIQIAGDDLQNVHLDISMGDLKEGSVVKFSRIGDYESLGVIANIQDHKNGILVEIEQLCTQDYEVSGNEYEYSDVVYTNETVELYIAKYKIEVISDKYTDRDCELVGVISDNALVHHLDDATGSVALNL